MNCINIVVALSLPLEVNSEDQNDKLLIMKISNICLRFLQKKQP